MTNKGSVNIGLVCLKIMMSSIKGCEGLMLINDQVDVRGGPQQCEF